MRRCNRCDKEIREPSDLWFNRKGYSLCRKCRIKEMRELSAAKKKKEKSNEVS